MESQESKFSMDKSRGKKLPFVNKLLEILDREDFRDIVHWDQDGTAIVVEKVLQFESMILPKFFDSSRMDSFSRQLNIYGFKRISDSRKQKTKPSERTSAFHNPNFIRGRPELLQLITRQKNPRKSNPNKPIKADMETTYGSLTSNSTPQLPEVSTFGFHSSPLNNHTTGMFDLPNPMSFYPHQPFLPSNTFAPQYASFPEHLPSNIFSYPYPNTFPYFNDYYPSS